MVRISCLTSKGCFLKPKPVKSWFYFEEISLCRAKFYLKIGIRFRKKQDSLKRIWVESGSEIGCGSCLLSASLFPVLSLPSSWPESRCTHTYPLPPNPTNLQAEPRSHTRTPTHTRSQFLGIGTWFIMRWTQTHSGQNTWCLVSAPSLVRPCGAQTRTHTQHVHTQTDMESVLRRF